LVKEERIVPSPVWVRRGKALLYAIRGSQPLRVLAIGEGSKPEIVDVIDDSKGITRLLPSGGKGAILDFDEHYEEIWKLDVTKAGGQLASVRRVPHSMHQVRVTEDGRRLLFVQDGRLWMGDLGGGPAREIAALGEAIFNPRLSPDGKWIALTGFPSDGNADLRSRIYIVSADGGILRRVCPETEDLHFESWSRDGRRLYVSRPAGIGKPGFQLWTVNIDGGGLRLVAEEGGFGAEETEDARSVYFASTPYSKLFRTVPSGGPPVRIPFGEMSAGVGSGVAAGKSAVYFVARAKELRSRIYRYVPRLDKVEFVADVSFHVSQPQLTRDEKGLFLVGGPPPSHRRMMVEPVH